MDKKAILFLGPPGSGKGTQAEMVLKLLKNNYEIFDSGKTLEKMIHNKKLLAKNLEVRKARRAFLSGKLVDPLFTLNFVKKAAKATAQKKMGIIFTGSPRTILEAEGNKNVQGLLSQLEELYGRENVIAVLLDITAAESVKRNSKRGRPGLDEPAVIKIRYREYQKNTLPVIQSMRKRKMKVKKINGQLTVKIISKNVLKALDECGLAIGKSYIKKSYKIGKSSKVGTSSKK